MRIHCDACSAPIEKEDAVVRQDEDGELFYFCSEECADEAERVDPDETLEPADERRR